jgi:hypothetical protein
VHFLDGDIIALMGGESKGESRKEKREKRKE